MAKLGGKVALVTGGAAGLGAALAGALVSEDAAVVMTDVQTDAGSNLARQLGCCFIPQDVTDESAWATVLAEVQRTFGDLDILVNNAGIEGPFEHSGAADARLSDWQAIHRVNVEGVFLGCRSVLPAMRRRGSIINLSSVAGLGPTPDFVAYGSSKAAVTHLTKSIALFCARNGSGIRCNSVHPGVVLTPMLKRIAEATGLKRGVATDEVVDELRRRIPQQEFQTEDDVSKAVIFLASDDSIHITGTALVVDGGISLGG